MQPLTGIRILDFSTLLPGPLATLILAEAGAEVIKVERPGCGDELRQYEPRFTRDNALFTLLNRGKRSISVDLKSAPGLDAIRKLLANIDVVVEQFRPGVMDRLGLGFDAVRHINERIIYCSITGYGQSGPLANQAGHDLNYMAHTGLLACGTDADGRPGLPLALIADIGAGAYPAVMNVLLALRDRDHSGTGCHLDVSMTDNLFPWMASGLAQGFAFGAWPRAGRDLLNGGSPRYQIYRTSDNKYVAAAPLEQRFWDNFCDVIGLEPAQRDDGEQPQQTIDAVAALIGKQTAAHWAKVFEDRDVCCSIVISLKEAVRHVHFREHDLFSRTVSGCDGQTTLALPLPIDRRWWNPETKSYPSLGEANVELFGDESV